MAQPVPVIIDTDCGVDDAVALWWALTSPALDVIGITCVWGNTGAAGAAANVCAVLEAAGRPDIPVALGAAGPFGDAPELRVADFIHGVDGLGDQGRPGAPFGPGPEHAVDLLRRLVDERPGEVVVIPVGPLSNIAAVLEADPTWATRVADLVIMGGSAVIQGNALPLGEANIAHDPVAAQLVVTADWPRPPVMVGLDVTLQATFTDDIFDLLAEQRSPAAVFLDGPMRFYRTFGSTFTPGECPCHDLLAVMAVADPEILVTEELPLAVQATPGPAWGQTVVDRRGPYFAAAGEIGGMDAEQPAHDDGFRPWRIAFGVDVEAFRDNTRALFGGGS